MKKKVDDIKNPRIRAKMKKAIRDLREANRDMGEAHFALVLAKMEVSKARERRNDIITGLREVCEHKKSIFSFSPNYLADIKTATICTFCGKVLQEGLNHGEKDVKGSRCVSHEEFLRIRNIINSELGLSKDEK